MFESNKSGPLAARMAGVKVARDVTNTTSKGRPNTVTNVAKAEVVFVGYHDDRGNAATAMYFKVGDSYMAPKETSEWCGKLLPMADWMRPQLDAALAKTGPVELPADDSVDVMAG